MRKEEPVLFLINPISGNGKKEKIAEEIKQHFPRGEYDAKVLVTKFPGDATQIARQYLHKGFTNFVVVGGDGTVNETARALVHSDAKLGIVPVGSGNGLARHLKIPLKISKSLDVIKRGKSRIIDYGRLNEQFFFCTAGVGFDAHIGDVFMKSNQRGFSTYFRSTLAEFRRYKPQKYRLKTLGGEVEKEAFLITFANASQYGNNAFIAPNASVEDGKMNVVIMKPFPITKALSLGPRLFLKSILQSPYVESFECASISVDRPQNDVVHCDGESFEMGTELSAEIVSEGLEVFVP